MKKNKKTEIEKFWKPWIEISNRLQNLVGNRYSARCEFNDLIKNVRHPQQRKLIAAALNVARFHPTNNDKSIKQTYNFFFCPLCSVRNIGLDINCSDCFANPECRKYQYLNIVRSCNKKVAYDLAMQLYRRLYYNEK